ncbi:MAG: tRNA (adenosine(37)-N6)-threonylcarbamoyltransferase complex transferase subunit TsaD [Alphaproteobacteria bacterium]|nr:tRNA (adenosine(37)-N6)-threonylcarbamoyltransferase complex transferase subunit TsaD [Alphaproteobacteria bacterium]
MIALGIETSCDETAAAIVDGDRRILSSVVASQLDRHRLYGGVVPEVAARAHLELLQGLVRQALDEARLDFDGLDLVAATAGPGLIGGVIVGSTFGKALSLARSLPFLAINHLEGHALSPRLSDNVSFPYLLLLVSGGHCQLLAVEGVGRYRRYGTTVDDAAGEAFDKAAKKLGLGFPGGPAIERAAKTGDATRFPLPRPMLGRPGCDFSFSGLKTAVAHAVDALGHAPTEPEQADLAASFQESVAASLADRTKNALRRFTDEHGSGHALVVAGGVAANTRLREVLAELARTHHTGFVAPPLALCTDNAAMIAWAGIERRILGEEDGLDVAPRPRWPLDAEAPPAPYAGAKA